MNGDVICNGRSPFHRLLQRSSSKSQHHEAISVKLIQDGKTSQLFCTQNEPQKNGDSRRGSTVNGEFILPKTAVNEELVHRAEEQTHQLHCTASYIHASSDITSPSQRKRACRTVKVKKSTKRITDTKSTQSRKVTDYYPIRRSSRKSKSELKCEEKRHIDMLITNGIENGMMVRCIEGKGRGVFATQKFQKGQYVVEYHGDLLQITDAKKREALYTQDPTTGCYMYYFQYLSKTYCVDATKESDRLGRLINHSKTGNCQTKLHDINGIPHLILVASRDIQEGEELLYDYGDRSKASIEAHPWLKH
ncbi:N-lysine methyltransferase KMT5A-A-like [Sinocyclocheilus anshuiensis]|uniref:[histone H4]-lysine(20) N-methyltransferase n=1 Tax=Sinocyclocheilus anshuiensis TaxID=1608454 RepID=A0A671NJC0_9TELE|nr:PREDICTED: N-lysine methyltransferase KMT5A-A-like [Sinocyclocheilus anshuiensis]